MSKFYGAIETYLSLRADNTVRQYRQIIKQWLEFCGSEELAFVTDQGNVWAFIAHLKKQKGQVSRITNSSEIVWNTIQRKLIVLKAIYDHLMKANLTLVNPFDEEQFTQKRTSRAKRATEQVPFEEVMKLISVPGTKGKKLIRDTTILTLLFAGGLRRSEVTSLELRDIKITQFGTVYIRLKQQKNGEITEQALPQWSHEHVLLALETRKKEGALQHHPLVTHYRGELELATNEPIDDKTLYRYFKKYCRLAGLPTTLTPHSARATAVTKLLQDGMSYREVQEFSRHASVTMVEVYDKRVFGVERSPAKKLSYS